MLGLYFLAVAVTQVLKIISGLGLDLTLSKFISGADGHVQRDTLASTLAIRFISVLAIGLVFYAVGQFILPVFGAGLNDYVVLMIVLYILTSYRDLFLSLMQGMHQYKEYAVAEVLSALTRVILLVAFHNRLSLQGLLYIEIITQLIEILLQLFFARGLLLSLSRQNFTSESARNITQFGTPLYTYNLLERC